MPKLYSLTLQKATSICQAVQGSFSGPKVNEILVSRGKLLELLRPEEQTGKLKSICVSEVFGIIRHIATFRQTGNQVDYVAIGSDAGRIVILQFNSEKNCFVKIHQETYGKTGVRRIVPGQYLAADPKGRALMLGAVEKCKFVYVLNRDASNALTISSPLEAHKSHHVCFALTAADNGFDHPIFVSIEQNIEGADRPKRAKASRVNVEQQYTGTADLAQGASMEDDDDDYTPPPRGLAWWEMDLGLNHVIKKCTMPVDDTAHAVIPVPAGTAAREGPSGVIVCCENFVVYKKPEFPEVVCALPRRLEMGQDKSMMIVAHAIHRVKDFFFILLQSEYGDLYKIELLHKDGIVQEVICKYFDTIPVANSICVLRSGYLFAAAEFGNHQLYQFTGIGTDTSDPVCTSLHPHGGRAIVAFKPRGLKNLLLIDELLSYSPITDMKIMDALSEGVPQIYVMCGRGPKSQLRILQHGITVDEMADNDLPGKPRAVWSLKESVDADFDSHIVVSFKASTLVLAVGETVEEVASTQLLTDVSSVHVALMFDNSTVQIHSNGFRHIRPRGIVDWKAAPGKRIEMADSNSRQVVVGLSGGDVLFFEMDETNTLTEVAKKDMLNEVTCISIQPIPKGRTRANFVAVGGQDNTVRILSLERDRGLRQLAVQALPNDAHPESCAIVQIVGMGYQAKSTTLFLCVGIATGVLMRAVLDPLTGQISDQRSRFIGARAVRLNRVTLGSGASRPEAIIALSVKPWVCHNFQGRFTTVPLHYDQLEFVSSFSSEQCLEGFVAIAGNSLRIFQCARLGEVFSSLSIPLSYTPRKFTPLPPPITEHQLLAGLVPPEMARQCMLAIVEADHNSYDEATKAEIREALRRIELEDEDDDEGKKKEGDAEKDEKNEDMDLSEEQIGSFKAGPGKWGSCLRIVDPQKAATIQKIHTDIDEAAVSVAVCRFVEYEAPCLVVGTVYNMSLAPRHVPIASIKVYAYDVNYNLTLLHSTPIEDAPMALCAWNGRLLASVGNRIRIYALGKKRLLKKCEYRNLPEGIVWLRVVGDRIFAADIREGIHVLKYRERENLLHVLADDTTPCWMTCAEVLDYHTVVGGDKFNGVRVTRIPEEAMQDEKIDVTGLKLKGDTSYLTGSTHKLEHLNHFYVGDIVMALQKATLSPGGAEVVVWGTIMGSVGAFLPIQSKDELDFLQHLEMALRTEAPPLCGRDHVSFRSYQFPVKDVIDGDLCEQYCTLSPDAQGEIAQQLERTPAQIMKKIEEIRNRIL